MSVLGRKMFKDPSNRGARNMLKGMGGIMSSSPELANAVQGYSTAGQVRIPRTIGAQKDWAPRGEGGIPLPIQGNYTSSGILTDKFSGLSSSPSVFRGMEELYQFNEYLNNIIPPALRKDISFETHQPIYNQDGSIKGIVPRTSEWNEQSKDLKPSIKIDEKELNIIREAVDEANANQQTIPWYYDFPEGKSNITEGLAWLGQAASSAVFMSAKGQLALYNWLKSTNPGYLDALSKGTATPDDHEDIAQLLKNREEVFADQDLLVEGRRVEVTRRGPEGDSERLIKDEAGNIIGVEQVDIKDGKLVTPDYEGEEAMSGQTAAEVLQGGTASQEVRDLLFNENTRADYEEISPRQPYKEPLVRMAEEKAKKEALEAPEVFVDSPVGEGQAPPEVEMSGTAEALTEVVTDSLPDEVFGDTHEEKVSSVEDIMAAFMSKAPKFKGMDKGMAIAKIGFAMAAGQSPNALTNIANAFSMGADMFIEDKKERDAFERQLGLAALKYGMQEEAAVRAQNRADLRSRNLYVVGKDPVTIEGVKYKPGQHVTLNEAQVQTLGPKMKNLASIEAMQELAAIQIAEWEAKFGKPGDGLGFEQAISMQEDYLGAMDAAEDATRGITILDSVRGLITSPETSPFRAGLKGKIGQLWTKGKVFFGADADTKYKTMDMIESKILQSMSSIVEVTVGETQSANSISDRDVLYQVIKPFFGGLITGDDANGYYINLTDEELVLEKIDGAIDALLASQRQRLIAADQIADNLNRIPKIKGYVGTGADMIANQQGRRARYDLGKLEIPEWNLVTVDGQPTLQLVGDS